jgi:hypothetical protein
MSRVIWLLFGRPLLIASSVIAAVLLISHLRLGDTSPGILRLAEAGMSYWIPLLMLVLFVLPSGFGVWHLVRVARFAKSRGLTLSTYLSLPAEEKLALQEHGRQE